MVKKWSTAHQLRQGANRLPPTIRCLGLLRFWLEKIIFFHLREQIFFLERQITGNTPEFDALSIPHTHRTGTFFYDRVPTRFRFLRRKKKEEERKNANREDGLTWIFFSSHVCFRNCGFETVPFGRHVALSPELLIDLRNHCMKCTTKKTTSERGK